MSDDRKFVRVFYNDMIRDYPEVWADNDQLATWLRMLATADPMWPTPPELSRSVKARILEKLRASSLVEMVTDDRYRMKGLDKERSRRSDAGRNAAAVRWHDNRTPAPDADPMPTRPDQTQTRPDADTPRAPEDPADIYWQLTGKYPGDKVLAWIDDISLKYGPAAVIKALAVAHIADRSTSTLLGRTQDRLRAEARELDRKEKAEEQERLREKRAKPRVLEPWQEEFRRRIQEQYEGAA